ncbi:MAG: formyltetrahydrofolate deformylase [Gammaproteobacteria bacterium]|nr:formyltetrahydrofolate deformylase [Gammaproteobacteria bacterium]
MTHKYRLIIFCPDRVGIVAAVSQYIAKCGGWMTEANYHADAASGWFFMRTEIKADSLAVNIDTFKAGLAQMAEEFAMTWRLSTSMQKPKVILLASLTSHCLADILHRWHRGELFCDIAAIISNHQKLANIAAWHDVPYHYVPITKANKESANREIEELIDQYKTNVIVLARYMQIISPHLCQKYRYRMINIHHSFLPSFAGANPYQQALERGVKIIGATCHYVTDQLDEGPIIEQDIVRISHRHNKEDIVLLGQDVEQQVLARGLSLHLEDRVVVHDNKTIVFE